MISNHEYPRQSLDAVLKEFELHAELLRRSGSRLAPALASRIVDDRDEAMLELASYVQLGQPVPPLLISAVHYLALQDPSLPIAAFFASIAEKPRPVAEAWPVFRAFCLERRDTLIPLLATRTIQTTMAERAATLLPGLARVAVAVGAPFTLIEVGCSAGFNLLVDRHRFRFVSEAGETEEYGNPQAPMTIEIQTYGNRLPLPQGPLALVERIGIDLYPVDYQDRAHRNWTIAMMQPDNIGIIENIRKAFELLAMDPPKLLRGDATIELPRLLSATDGPVCVMHSCCLYQWPVEMRTRLAAAMQNASVERVVHCLGVEPDWARDEALRHNYPEQTTTSACFNTHTVYAGGSVQSETALGFVEGYARWIDWRA